MLPIATRGKNQRKLYFLKNNMRRRAVGQISAW